MPKFRTRCPLRPSGPRVRASRSARRVAFRFRVHCRCTSRDTSRVAGAGFARHRLAHHAVHGCPQSCGPGRGRLRHRASHFRLWLVRSAAHSSAVAAPIRRVPRRRFPHRSSPDFRLFLRPAAVGSHTGTQRAASRGIHAPELHFRAISVTYGVRRMPDRVDAPENRRYRFEFADLLRMVVLWGTVRFPTRHQLAPRDALEHRRIPGHRRVLHRPLVEPSGAGRWTDIDWISAFTSAFPGPGWASRRQDKDHRRREVSGKSRCLSKRNLLIRDTPHVRLYVLNMFRMKGSRL